MFLMTVTTVQQVAQSMIDFSPLVPVINGLITAIAGVALAAIPPTAYYAVVWLRNHGIAVSAKAQGEIVNRASDLVQKGRAFVAQQADNYVENKLKVAVPSSEVATVANFMISQAPDLVKKMGADPTTVDGQQKLVQFVISHMTPSAPVPDATLGVTLTAATPSASSKPQGA